ncbi:hypothetical protein EJ07DRAFT_155972 [Lizonia empirigonia]|nr:hypothetical protein EJ07DRAFT_155972 [Lizonia empirigonia]
MASTPLILTLTVLTAIILALLIIWVFIRYTRERRTRHVQRRLQLDHDAALVTENGESSGHPHCTYQPPGAPHAVSHGATQGVELQALSGPKRSDSGEKAEVWLRRGASKDNLRAENVREGGERGLLGTTTVKAWGNEKNVGAWDMVAGRPRDNGLEGAGRAA